ncbi:MAG: alkaline phosphatase family protein [Candidatus Aminicenantes bacterium]|nr:alkaline phosphatase family protein [Candidatus Aminicenantes bacterium]
MYKKPAFFLLASAGALCLVFFFTACQHPKEADEGPPKAVIIGLDGAGWNLINPLLEKGRLPNIRRLMESGGHGFLKTARPVKSSVVWTSIATGKTMVKHGVLDWSYIDRNDIEVPYRQSERRTKAFWNILGDMGWRVGVINWFITYPAEPVNGYMISEEFRHLGRRDFSQADVTYPALLLKKLEFTQLKDSDFKSILEEEHLPLFQKHSSAEEGKALLVPFYKDFVFQDKIIENASLYLFKRDPVDVFATYLRLIDVVSHFACAYIDESLLAKGTEEEEKQGSVSETTLALIDKNFSEVMDPIYSYCDKVVGEFLDMIDSRTTLIVVSDHAFGFQKGGYGHVKLPEIPHGIILIKGPHIKRNYTIRDASIFDILPTLLYVFGMPTGEDMDGKVLTEVFDKKFLKKSPVRFIASYEDEGRVQQLKRSRQLDEKQLEEFRALGYIKK